MSRLPIRLRITVVFAVVMAVVLAASGAFLYLRLQSHLDLALDRELELRAQDLSELVSQPHASLAGDTSRRFVEQGESYAELLAPSGRVLDATRPLAGRRLLSRGELRTAADRTTILNRGAVPGLNEPSRLLATPVQKGGRRYVLVVGTTRQNDIETLSSFRDELLLTGPAALLLASLAGYVLAGLSLRQVEAMRARAASISADHLGERLPVLHTGDELERLGTTLNDMLGRLEAALESERQFVADAGHELRTPLALLRTELELAERHAETPEDLRAAVRAASFETERLAQLAEDLLLIARADGDRLPLRVEDVDVATLFDAVASRFEWRAADLEKTLRREPTDAHCSGDPLRLQQALGNLVDNALRYGGSTIVLEAVVADDAVRLHVRDDGDGVPAAFAPRAFDRFSRLDAARSAGGAGLGLAIVRTIAEAHGGTASIENYAGGFDAWIAVPSAR